MSELDRLFEQFLRERIYLHNVTSKTAEWYRMVWRVFLKWWVTLPTEQRSRTLISRIDLQEFVVHLRERGVRPVSCNCYLRGINAFCRWLHQEGHIPSASASGTAARRKEAASAPRRSRLEANSWLVEAC